MAYWRRAVFTDAAVPVEMRFVDMFMAALGALLFMAMLFVFLIANVGVRNVTPTAGPGPTITKLEILTKTLPNARANEQYAVAVAVRGGARSVSWRMDGQLPAGMEFNNTDGVISGAPKGTTVGRFIVSATEIQPNSDGTRSTVSQPLELTVEQSKPKARDVEKWLAGLMLFAMACFWMLLRIATGGTAESLAALKVAYAAGETEYSRSSGEGKIEYVQLPTGIYSEEAQLAFLRRLSHGALLIIVGFAAWFVYRLWIG